MRPRTRRNGSKLFEPMPEIEANVLGPRGVSEHVLEAMGQTDRHRFVPGRSARWHTWTGRFSLGRAKQYRSRS